jgi:hypothetical protein
MDFALDTDAQQPRVYGPIGVQLRARLYASDGSAVADLAMVEDVATPAGQREYYGTVALSPAPADSVDADDAYSYEVRQVTAQTAGAFDASTTVIIVPGFYGYAISGDWSDDAPSGQEGRYTTEAKCERFLGSLNLTTYNDTDDDGDRDADSVLQAIESAESNVDLETGGPYTFTANLNGQVAASNFERWSRYLACTEMVNKRLAGQAGDDAEQDRATVYGYRKEALNQMKRFKAGELTLPGALPANVATGEGGRVAGAPTVAGSDGSAITAAQVSAARRVSRCGGVPFVC